ncbi:surface lipoprotein assembly modifier [Neisseria wadsworthii]|uniref:surface lipoprotein assembly modifier n=1 Tax=Neisseria wadsworthii TaxID=607711 RepID=UPI0015F51DA1|nr:surface lipoprotein assembly modifier [Neisseria wadsworthii]QMT36312.1 DUF560 domain-containing protein [Neisseria wadsworthii]
MKKIVFYLAALAFPAAFADTPAPLPAAEPELHLNTAQPSPFQEESSQPSSQTDVSQERVIPVDGQVLLNHPELLAQAMGSAVLAQNISGIRQLLPIYRQWPQHDKELAEFSRAMLAQANGHAADAVGIYRKLIAQKPDSPTIRFKLAQALFDNKENEAAANQFDRLQSENLSEETLSVIKNYREALRQRDNWQFYAGINISRENNINQAPAQRRKGYMLDEPACLEAKQADPGDNCFRGWTFDAPINATGIYHQAGAEKKWSLAKGFYIQAGIDSHGKIYPSYSRYNDLNLRLSAGIGHANQRNDIGITPFHERRFYGSHAYSYNNGIRLYWNRWQTPRLQSLAAFEYNRLNNTQRTHSDTNGKLLSGTLVFHRNASQHWLAGPDFYQERNPDDRSDNFNLHNLRVAWGQDWQKGFASRLQLVYGQRRYQTSSFFSEQQQRRDKETTASLSLWHRAVHFGGMTPKLTLSRQRTKSNDQLHEYAKNRVFIELGKTF